MALKASGFAGTAKLHDLTAGGVICDLCGEEVDSEVADAVALDCSFAQCDPESSCYHCYCLEKFLKSIKCERNRKIGFPCPRGCGKGTKFKDSCRGKILKSHPVSTRSEANKKRRQAELEQLAQQSAVRDKGSRKKEEEARAAAKATKGREKEERARAKTVAIKALNVANTSITTAPPPKTAAQLQKEQLAAEAKKLKSQILARSSSGASSTSSAAATGTTAKAAAAASGRTSAAGSAGGKKEMKTLDEYFAERTSASSTALERSSSVTSSAAPSTSAWGKSRASSASSLEAAEIADAAAAAAGAPPAPPLAAPATSLSSEEAFPPPTPAGTSAAAPGKPPRPPAAPAAAAAAAQPQGAWAHKPAVAVVAAAPSAPPPPPPRPTPAAAAAPPKTKAEETKLSRTQRKNQRRAEKKAAAAAAAAVAAEASADADAGSPADSTPGSPHARSAQAAPAADPSAAEAGVGGSDEVLERCMQALVQHRLQRQVDQLCALGFPGGAALAAVQQHGGSLEGALVALLEQATGVRDSMHGLGLGGGAPAEVDLSEELQQMLELQARYGLPPGAVELLAVEHLGDLDSLAASLAQQAATADYPGASQQPGVQQQQQQQQAAAPAGDALGGGGLFGTLAPSPSEHSQQSYSADSWGQGTYSAFGFGGFAEAALHAVHGGSVLGSGADSSSLVSAASGGLGSSIWGGGAATLAGSQAAAGGYTSDAQLLSLLGVSDQAAVAAVASQPSTSGGLGLLGAFDSLQQGGGSQSIFAQPATTSLAPAHQHLAGSSGWPSGESLGAVATLPHPQSALASLPLWSQGSSGLGGLSQSDSQDLLVR